MNVFPNNLINTECPMSVGWMMSITGRWALTLDMEAWRQKAARNVIIHFHTILPNHIKCRHIFIRCIHYPKLSTSYLSTSLDCSYLLQSVADTSRRSPGWAALSVRHIQSNFQISAGCPWRQTTLLSTDM